MARTASSRHRRPNSATRRYHGSIHLEHRGQCQKAQAIDIELDSKSVPPIGNEPSTSSNYLSTRSSNRSFSFKSRVLVVLPTRLLDAVRTRIDEHASGIRAIGRAIRDDSYSHGSTPNSCPH